MFQVAFSCCFLSAALYTQFAVRLRNVFDTQVRLPVINQDDLEFVMYFLLILPNQI